MKASKLLILLPLFALSLSVSSVFSNEVEGIDDNDHAALAKYYENHAHEAEEKLHKNEELLKEYEDHPYYYGRQGQDIQSHTLANIHEYEKVIEEDLHHADDHKKVMIEENNPVGKVSASQERHSITEK
ncbi:MAG: hypothetical protein H0X02_11170 [Nitrosomonas sp.]|nr:hypothetical protein [Nitrosomonas sp.]